MNKRRRQSNTAAAAATRNRRQQSESVRENTITKSAHKIIETHSCGRYVYKKIFDADEIGERVREEPTLRHCFVCAGSIFPHKSK